MGKLFSGFVLGFLACVWTYGLDPREAAFGFSHKVAAAHEHLEAEYRTDPSYGHKGQYRNYNSRIGAEDNALTTGSLAKPSAYWLSRSSGSPAL